MCNSRRWSSVQLSGRMMLIALLCVALSGCMYWLRAYQTYLQMQHFDQHFSIHSADDFRVHFYKPTLYSEDFVSLAKLRPSTELNTPTGKRWEYRFRKKDQFDRFVEPAVQFSFFLTFNQEDLLTDVTFSPLFLQIAPADFLELSIRSVGTGEINKDKRQLKVDTSKVAKIDAPLPLQAAVFKGLGEPLLKEPMPDKEQWIYHFMLDAHDIQPGYESRALNVVKLTFDQQSQALIKMAGSFAGLKLAINYQKYQQTAEPLK